MYLIILRIYLAGPSLLWILCFLEDLSHYNPGNILCGSFSCLSSSIITDIENRLVLAKGEGSKEGVNWEFGVSGYKLLHIKWINNNVLLHNTVQFSRSVVSDSLRPHELQHARPPCPSPTPGVHPSPCPLSWWCHPTISSSVVPFSSCPQSFPASGSFPMSQLFTSGAQSIGVSASTSVLPMNTQDWSLEWTGWISLQSKGLSRAFANTTVQKHQFFSTQLSL